LQKSFKTPVIEQVNTSPFGIKLHCWKFSARTVGTQTSGRLEKLTKDTSGIGPTKHTNSTTHLKRKRLSSVDRYK